LSLRALDYYGRALYLGLDPVECPLHIKDVRGLGFAQMPDGLLQVPALIEKASLMFDERHAASS